MSDRDRLRLLTMSNWLRYNTEGWTRIVCMFLYGNPWPSDPNPFPRFRLFTLRRKAKR